MILRVALLVPPIRNVRGQRRNKITEVPTEDFPAAILSLLEVFLGPGSRYFWGAVGIQVFFAESDMNKIVLFSDGNQGVQEPSVKPREMGKKTRERDAGTVCPTVWVEGKREKQKTNWKNKGQGGGRKTEESGAVEIRQKKILSRKLSSRPHTAEGEPGRWRRVHGILQPPGSGASVRPSWVKTGWIGNKKDTEKASANSFL